MGKIRVPHRPTKLNQDFKTGRKIRNEFEEGLAKNELKHYQEHICKTEGCVNECNNSTNPDCMDCGYCSWHCDCYDFRRFDFDDDLI